MKIAGQGTMGGDVSERLEVIGANNEGPGFDVRGIKTGFGPGYVRVALTWAEWEVLKANVDGFREAREAVSEQNQQSQETKDCPTCAGCGQVGDDKDRTPWKHWLALPLGSSQAVLAGLVKPLPCPACHGTGKQS